MVHPEPFHEGERAVQERAGETHTAILNARMIATDIMPGAIPFIARQPWVIMGGTDAASRLWCSALVGREGFTEANAAGTELRINLNQAPTHPDNPLLAEHPLDRPTGALFIELATRRRLRVNGHIRKATPDHLHIAVEESFPNCPKYIQKRTLTISPEAAPARGQSHSGDALGEAEWALISQADTLFLATQHPSRGVDVSHRGGRTGFVELRGERTLRLPDYPGNGLFQSLGNLAVDARMGMLIPVFDTGELLHLTGTAQVLWDVPGEATHTGGTGRFLEFQVERWVRTPPAAMAPAWTFVEDSPYNP